MSANDEEFKSIYSAQEDAKERMRNGEDVDPKDYPGFEYGISKEIDRENGNN